MNNLIKHKAYVKNISPDGLWVSIVNESACASCHVKGACTVSDYQEKDIEITSYSKTYQIGQEVTVLFKESNGFKALFFGYILPLVVLLSTLIVSLIVSENEALSGILSLLILIPYYTTLYFFRAHLKKIFNFEIEES